MEACNNCCMGLPFTAAAAIVSFTVVEMNSDDHLLGT